MGEEIKKFKLREEKHITTEIEFMAWSPSMDLLALANANAEVFVNRLSWQRVWSLTSPNEGDKVGGLSWRPDGKVIAIGYVSGSIRICDVEKGDVVHFGSVPGAVTSLTWLEKAQSVQEESSIYVKDNSDEFLPSLNEQTLRCDESSISPDQNTGLEAYETFRTLTAQKCLNILLVGTDKAQVHLLSYGVFPTGILDLDTAELAETVQVDSAIISPDLSSLFIILKADVGSDSHAWIKAYDTCLLFTRCAEIRLLAAKYVMIASARLELQVILQQMVTAWEELLKEMDTKLLRFAEEKKKLGQGGTVSNDFLELLLFGTTSLELQAFLLEELTDKGLKKLGFSIENSYTNIQKLVIRQLLRVSQNITSHLSDLHGMSQWHDKFGLLGLNSEMVNTAVKMAGAFAVSGVELQQVIETSLKNFKAFFRWLYIAILRLSNRPPPAEINKMSQHDIKFVADFLRDNFIDTWEIEEEEKIRAEEAYNGEEDSMNMDVSCSSMSPSSSLAAQLKSETNTPMGQPEGFRLEKVGQYLKKGDLTHAPAYHENPWVQFLQSSTFQSSSKILYPSMQGKSMPQRKEMLDEAIFNAVLKPATVIGASMQCNKTHKLFTTTESNKESIRPPKVCQFTDDASQLWVVFVTDPFPSSHLTLMKCPLTDTSHPKVARVQIGTIGDPFADDSSVLPDKYVCENHQLLDFTVYNCQTLTLLLREDRREDEEEVTLLLQLSLAIIPDTSFVPVDHTSTTYSNVPVLDVGPLLSQQAVDHQTGNRGLSIAVGGVRTTASVLLSSSRRIRLYLLEDGDGDDDEEDEEDGEEDEGNNNTVGSSVADVSTEARHGSNDGEDKENMIE